MTWAALHLLGHAGGSWLAAREPPPRTPRRPPPAAAARLAALAPAALALGGHPLLDVAVWTAVAGWAGAWGWLETTSRRSRPATAAPDPWSPSRRVRWRAAAVLRVTGWPRVSGQGESARWSAPAALLAIGGLVSDNAAPDPAPGDGLLLRGDGPPPRPGERLAGVVAAGPPAGAAHFGGFDMARHLSGRGLLWEGRLESTAGGRRDPPTFLIARLAGAREALTAGLAAGLPPREAGLMAAVLLGERGDGGRQLRDAFARLGLSHLFAVSGLHVGIVVGLLFFLARPLAPGPWSGLLLGVLFLPVYAALTGMSGSVVRAAGLGLLALAVRPLGRRQTPLRMLGLLFWINCQAAPWTVLDTGTRLSYLAAGGIVATMGAVVPICRDLPAAARWLLGGLAATVGAQWATLAETASAFGWLHPLAAPLNLIAVPMFAAAVWLAVLGLGAGVVAPWLAQALLAASWLVLRVLEGGVCAVDHAAPHALGIPPLGPGRLVALLLLTGAATAALRRAARSAGRARGVWLACLLPALAGTVAILPAGRGSGRHMAAWQIAVGQGDACLLTFPDGAAVLVDAGPPGPAGGGDPPLMRELAPWLRREGIRRIAVATLSHGHDDHTGGAAALARTVPVGAWSAGGAAAALDLPCAPGTHGLRLARGDTLHADAPWALICVHAPGEGARGENDRSLALALWRGPQPVALWTGDLELGGESALLAGGALPAGAGLQAWKAGHHGSRTSGGRDLLAAHSPALVLVSCGVANRHRHPSHGPYVVGGDTLPVARTDLEGSVALLWDDEGSLRWRTASGRSGRVPPPLQLPAALP